VFRVVRLWCGTGKWVYVISFQVPEFRKSLTFSEKVSEIRLPFPRKSLDFVYVSSAFAFRPSAFAFRSSAFALVSEFRTSDGRVSESRHQF